MNDKEKMKTESFNPFLQNAQADLFSQNEEELNFDGVKVCF